MMRLFDFLFPAPQPAIQAGDARDARLLAQLHAAVFRRGWSESEFESLLADRSVSAHTAAIRGRLVGFILSRRAADEAEILSLAVAPREQGRGVARDLLALHLRHLAGLGIRTIYLEVDEANAAAMRLYRRAGFVEAGRRPAYYPQPAGTPAAALILRRNLN